MKTLRTKLAFGVIAGALLLSASAAYADTPWQARHPRQEEVLNRAHRELGRIHEERVEGDLTRGQAQRLRAADERVIREDHRMAYRNGGYITRGQQYRLNRQENHIGRHIPG
jgi:hypothetical protein